MPTKLDSLLAKIRAHTRRERAMVTALDILGNESKPLPEAPENFVGGLASDHEGQHAAPIAAACVISAPVLCTAVVITWLVARRELAAVWLLVGLAVQALAGEQARQGLQGPRPTTAFYYGLYSYGMPCERAQTVAFIASYALLLRWFSPTALSPLGKVAYTLAALGITLAVTAASVCIGVTHREQGAAGVGMGLLLGAVWYLGFSVLRRPVLAPLLEHNVSRLLHLRDSSRIPDFSSREFEWIRSLTVAKEM